MTENRTYRNADPCQPDKRPESTQSEHGCFRSIVSNIGNLGIKRPITVVRRKEPVDGKIYDLICGQGRLEAFIALGQAEIPAIVQEASKEECLLMSLIENIARRHPSSIELLREITSLNSRGYTVTQIAKKDRRCGELRRGSSIS